jgi:hypothetical protein
MIYINNQFVDFSKPDGVFKDIVAEYHKTVNDLRKKFGKFIIIRSRKEAKVNKTGLLEQLPPKTIPLKIVLGGANGSEEWLYTETFPIIKDGIAVTDTNQLIVQHGELRIDLNKKPDLAYFLTKKHSALSKGKFYVLDVEAKNRTLAEQRARDAKLNNAIYGENSQLNTDLDFLRLISKRWGIGGADKQDKFALQNQLYDIVSRSDKDKGKGRGVDEFVSDIKSSGKTDQLEIAAKVRDAIDRKVVIFDELNHKWQIDYKDGKYKDIVFVSIEDLPSKDEVLVMYMCNDNALYAQLVAAIGDDGAELVIDDEEVAVCNERDKLYKWAKALEINPLRLTNEKLRTEILAKLKELNSEK